MIFEKMHMMCLVYLIQLLQYSHPPQLYAFLNTRTNIIHQQIIITIVSVPVCSFGFREATGHWPDFSNSDDLKALGAEAFAFVNFARLAVPLRIGLALSTTPWVEENIVKKFLKKDIDDENCVIPEDE